MKDEELVSMLTAPGKKRRERKVHKEGSEEATNPPKEEDEKGRIRGQSLEDIVKMAKIKRQLREKSNQT